MVGADLLGWELDPVKEKIAPMLTLLGLGGRVSAAVSEWSVCSRKRTEWAESVKRALVKDTLVPGMASKFYRRFAFLNARICFRLGRALLRPLIWRQRQSRGCSKLTPRLRFALIWFLRVLETGITRLIS